MHHYIAISLTNSYPIIKGYQISYFQILFLAVNQKIIKKFKKIFIFGYLLLWSLKLIL